MRQWQTNASSPQDASTLAVLIQHLGSDDFQHALIAEISELVPAGSYALYRTGRNCLPQLFLSSSHGTPDRTQACWAAYRQGIHLDDQTLPADSSGRTSLWMSHLTAPEVPVVHRQAIYEAHDLSERLSIHKPLPQGGVLALNYYRHSHQRPFTDAHIGNFEHIATALLALVEKHIQWTERPVAPTVAAPRLGWRAALQLHEPRLTERELDVCLRLLQGMTHEGIARDLGISTPTVKTYRNRAFGRLDIHYRNQLFAVVHAAQGACADMHQPATQA